MGKKLKEKLDLNLWITRKCRINASQRLLRSSRFIEFINIYFSIIIILLSLIQVTDVPCKCDTISFVSLSGSITLTICIVFANSLGYRDRAAALKQNYIALQALLDQLTVTDENNIDGLLKICDDYTSLLESVENHSTIDMLKLMRSNHVSNHAMTFGDHCTWLLYCFWQILWKGCLIFAPICYFIYIFL